MSEIRIDGGALGQFLRTVEAILEAHRRQDSQFLTLINATTNLVVAVDRLSTQISAMQTTEGRFFMGAKEDLAAAKTLLGEINFTTNQLSDTVANIASTEDDVKAKVDALIEAANNDADAAELKAGLTKLKDTLGSRADALNQAATKLQGIAAEFPPTEPAPEPPVEPPVTPPVDTGV